MKFLFGLIIGLPLMVVGQSTPFLPCNLFNPARRPGPRDFKIEGCTTHPCLMKRGTDVKAEWTFVNRQRTTKLTPLVTLLGVRKEPFRRKDACSSLKNAQCPVESGEILTQEVSIPILKSYPKIPYLLIEVSLVDDAGYETVCLRLPVRIDDV